MEFIWRFPLAFKLGLYDWEEDHRGKVSCSTYPGSTSHQRGSLLIMLKVTHWKQCLPIFRTGKLLLPPLFNTLQFQSRSQNRTNTQEREDYLHLLEDGVSSWIWYSFVRDLSILPHNNKFLIKIILIENN